MRKIEWLQPSLADLQGIFDYIAQDNLDRAYSFVREIETEVQKLSEFPMLGVEIKTDSKGDVRALHYKEYTATYRIHDTYIAVLEVCHQSKHKRRITLVK